MSVDLDIRDLTVRFGGVLAVDRVSLHAPAGEISGLIGPNGAGKTTTFNACTGMVQTMAGTVTLGDRRLDGHTPARRAQLGLGRTFQRIGLLDNLTVKENVTLGGEARAAGRHWWSQLWATRRERIAATAAAWDAIARCGIAELADVPARELTTGQQRLAELARVLAGNFRFLLLDEPSSGLDAPETERLGAVLRAVSAEGIGVLLVEHDLGLVRGVCTRVSVLDFGQLLLTGATDAVLDAPEVHAAYVGVP